MKLIVGLGNPGSKYRESRHNIGFDVVAELARRHLTARPKAKFNAEVAEVGIASCKCLLISPLTYMNLSGKSVSAAVGFYKTPAENVLVICDDLNLDVGRIRIRARGSAGGQNGIKDIIQRLGTSDFPRLRVGVGRPPPRWDAADYVLGKFGERERAVVDQGIKKAADAVEVWVGGGVQDAMNQFNANPNTSSNKKAQSKKTKSNPTVGADSDIVGGLSPENETEI